MNRVQIACLAVSIFFATASFVTAADEIVITHRSGKVQTLRIEQPDDPVESVSFKPGRSDQKAASPAPAPAVVPAKQITPETAKEEVKAAAKEDKGSGNIKLRWAEPMDVGY